VLGASTTDIVSLLTWNILRLVLVANVVAWTIAYFTMYRWLHNFASASTWGPGPLSPAVRWCWSWPSRP